MNEKPKKIYALLFAALLVVSLVAFTMPLASAKGGSGSISTPAGRLDWSVRSGFATSKYPCSAAPGGRVTGEHSNFELKLNDQKIFNFHVWIGYNGATYVSEGSWCIKIAGKATWKKLMEKVDEKLLTKLSKTTIKKLVANMASKEFFFPLVIITPNCNNPSKWDVYARLMCAAGGISGTVSL